MKIIMTFLLIASVCGKYDMKGVYMSKKCFEPNPYSYYKDIEDQYSIDEVESVWGEKIPQDLYRIGGDMLFGWIKICREDSDPEGILRGEYIDGEKRYKGKFRYFHPEGKPIPENLFSDHYLSNFASSKGVKVRLYESG